MKKKWLSIAVVACLFGIVFAGISLQNFYRISKSGMVDGNSFCAISDVINCDVIEASSYAHIGGLPLAGLGLMYYILLFFFTVWARFSRGFKKPTVAFAWWSTVPSILFSFALLYISISILRAVCLTCIGMYLVNFTLFISLYLAMRIPFSESFSFLWGYWYTFFTKKKRGIDFMPRVFFHVLISIIVFGIGLVFISSASSNVKRLSAREINGYVSSFYKQSSYDIRFAKDTTPMWGTKGAPVTIVEFSDYRCPFCKVAAFTIKPFLAEHRDNVAYYFLNYPLDSTCNHYMQHQMHPGACLGAKGGICAEKVGKFWEYHDKMFESSERINLELLKKLANRLSIDNSEFVKCVNSAETDLKLKEEIETARRIYVTGTPSVFVNNRHLKYWKSPEVLRKVVESEIKVSKKNN